MTLTSSTFLIFALIAIVLLRTARSGAPRIIVTLVLNAIFLVSLVDSPVALVPLLAFILLGYGAIILAANGRFSLPLGLLVTGIVVIFIWLKHYSIVWNIPTFGFAYTVVGLSYILFRILHVLIDVSQGALRRPPFVGYLNYVLFFLSLLSGPIQRYEDFAAQAQSRPPPLEWQEANIGAGRVVLGYLMVIVLGGAVMNFIDLAKPPFFTALTQREVVPGVWLFALLTSTYLLGLFLNFAGYMHIVIGIGRIAGFALPENFDHPFASRNFLDLWTRWHITLSDWFRFYLFNPLLKALGARWGTKIPMPYLGAVAFFATFLVMGAWHGTTPIFLIYGLFLGTGVTVNRLWQIWVPKFIGRSEYKAISARRWYRALSRSATLSYFAIALTSLWIDADHAVALIQPSGLTICLLAFLGMTAVGAIADCAVGIVAAGARLITDRGQPEPGSNSAPANISTLRQFIMPALGLLLLSAGGSAIALFATGALSGSSLPYAVAAFALCATTLISICLAAGMLDPALWSVFSHSLTSKGQSGAIAIWLGVKIMIVVNLAMLAISAPEFVYKAF